MIRIADDRPLQIQVGSDDVARLRAAGAAFRELDYRFGGRVCQATIPPLIHGATLLRHGIVPDRVQPGLCTTLADLHNLLGWAEFDIGARTGARRHFQQAADLAETAGNDALLANIHYRVGRMHLHDGDSSAALAEFARGRHAAGRAGSPLAHAILSANQAWAYAAQGQSKIALTLLNRAREEFTANTGTPPPWAAFFTAHDLVAMRGNVYAELARSQDIRYADRAVSHLTQAIGGYGPAMARSRVLSAIMLAVGFALQGELGQVSAVLDEAFRAAQGIGSARIKDRLRMLDEVLRREPSRPESRELRERITAFRAKGPRAPAGPATSDRHGPAS